ncbi:hypothetical protein [Enterococcus faecalis]|nr:hypothetical protein [Enterococcus faecalis]
MKEIMDRKVLDPKLVAKSVKFIYEMPQDILIREISIASTKQEE